VGRLLRVTPSGFVLLTIGALAAEQLGSAGHAQYLIAV
jgi:hypothetical protein